MQPCHLRSDGPRGYPAAPAEAAAGAMTIHSRNALYWRLASALCSLDCIDCIDCYDKLHASVSVSAAKHTYLYVARRALSKYPIGRTKMY
jgi:hypothetical protein